MIEPVARALTVHGGAELSGCRVAAEVELLVAGRGCDQLRGRRVERGLFLTDLVGCSPTWGGFLTDLVGRRRPGG